MQALPRVSLVVFCILCLTGALAAQTRSFNPLATAGTVDIASGGQFVDERTAVAWLDASDQTIWINNSDGRGVEWSGPVRVDRDTTGALKSAPRAATGSTAGAGHYVAVVWADTRFAPSGSNDSDVFFQVSYDNGTTWLAADVMLDKGLPGAGNNHVIDLQLSQVNETIAVLMLVENDSNGLRELYLNYSLDGGTSFLANAIPGGPSGYSVLEIAAIQHVHTLATLPFGIVAQESGTQTERVFFSMFDFNTRSYLTRDSRVADGNQGVPNSIGSIGIDFLQTSPGETIAIDWLWQPTSPTPSAQLNITYDRGQTWERPLAVGSNGFIGNVSPSSTSQTPAKLALILTPTGATRILAAWGDDRTGVQEVFVSSSEDDGVSWQTDLQLSSGGGCTIIVPHWRCFDDGTWITFEQGSSSKAIMATTTFDDGLAWQTPEMISDPSLGSSILVAASYNADYENLLVFWEADSDNNTENELYVGGRRRAYIVPSATSVVAGVDRLQFDGFDFNAEEEGMTFGVLAAAGTGNHSLPDGRLTGLAQDNILASSINFIGSGLLAGIIQNGAASTQLIDPVPPVPPMTLHCVGVAFELPGPIVSSLTDIELVDVQ